MPRIDHPMIQAMLKRAQEEATANPPPTAEELFAAEAEARPEAAARKQRSLATLAREGVPVNVHLPTIESEAEVRRRADEEVALRAIGLAIVAAKAQSRDHERTWQLIETYRIADGFTPEERAAISRSAVAISAASW